jgi:hypothetical protein
MDDLQWKGEHHDWKAIPDRKEVRLYPPPSKDFDPFAATAKDLMRHGLPGRPDRRTQPEMAALWERLAARYRSFDHIEPRLDTTTVARKAVAASALGPDPIESCAYQLFSSPAAPFTALFVTRTALAVRFSKGFHQRHCWAATCKFGQAGANTRRTARFSPFRWSHNV